MKKLLLTGLLMACSSDTIDWSSPATEPGQDGGGDGADGTDGTDGTDGADGGGDSGADGGDDGPPDSPLEELPAAEEPILPTDEALFDEVTLPEIAIELSEEAVASLLVDPYVYVHGTFIFEGERVEDVAIRTKGENSWRPINEKPSLKIKFDGWVEDQEFRGLTDLTLNAMNNDVSMMHERVAYKMYREFGIPAARSTHGVVTLNGDSYGLYTVLETVNRDMMKQWYEDPDGTLFEQHDVDFYDAYIPCVVEDTDTAPAGGGYACFQYEYGDETKTSAELRAPLQGLADSLESGTYQQRYDAAAAWLDWGSFIQYWAVAAVVGQYDSYPFGSPGDDCHVFVNPASGLIEFMPHGLDETFYYPTYDPETVNGILAVTCKNVPVCREAFVSRVWDVQSRAEEIDLYGYALDVQTQVSPIIDADDRHYWTRAEVTAYQELMIDMIHDRRATLESLL
jgi:hypothetical protein